MALIELRLHGDLINLLDLCNEIIALVSLEWLLSYRTISTTTPHTLNVHTQGTLPRLLMHSVLPYIHHHHSKGRHDLITFHCSDRVNRPRYLTYV